MNLRNLSRENLAIGTEEKAYEDIEFLQIVAENNDVRVNYD